MPPSVAIVVRRLTKHPKKTTKEPAGPDIGPTHPVIAPPRLVIASGARQSSACASSAAGSPRRKLLAMTGDVSLRAERGNPVPAQAQLLDRHVAGSS